LKEQNTNYLANLLELSRELNSSLDLDTVLARAIELVIDFVHAERGFILLDEKGKLTLKASHGIAREEFEGSREISQTIINTAFNDGKSVLSLNALEDPRFSMRESVQLSGVRSVLCVPLVFQERRIGIVYVDSRMGEGIFSEDHEEMLKAFANQAAVAIENARHHSDMEREKDEKLRIQVELLEEASRRQECERVSLLKSEFVSLVSHELRNPLTVIKNYIHILRKSFSVMDTGNINDFCDTLDAETDRLMLTIGSFLDLSRLDAGYPLPMHEKKVDPGKLINSLLNFMRMSPMFTRDHTFVAIVPRNLPPLMADEEKLRQILFNLVGNALKYSPKGGEVELGVRTDRGFFEFWVKDEGEGMPPEQQEKIFRKFQRAGFDKNIEGIGLGLYLTKHLVALHGGDIGMTSAPGKGTKFYFTIPIKKR
jgi:signal transduction histidine kinase